MGRSKNQVSPEVANRLLDMARKLRCDVDGGDGVPQWGTKFSRIEEDCVAVGYELARLMIEQSVEGLVQQVPDEALLCSGETAMVLGTNGTVATDTARTFSIDTGADF